MQTAAAAPGTGAHTSTHTATLELLARGWGGGASLRPSTSRTNPWAPGCGTEGRRGAGVGGAAAPEPLDEAAGDPGEGPVGGDVHPHRHRHRAAARDPKGGKGEVRFVVGSAGWDGASGWDGPDHNKVILPNYEVRSLGQRQWKAQCQRHGERTMFQQTRRCSVRNGCTKGFDRVFVWRCGERRRRRRRRGARGGEPGVEAGPQLAVDRGGGPWGRGSMVGDGR